MNPLAAALQARADRSPGDLVLAGDGLQLGAAELLAMVRELALELHACGAASVALLAENSPRWVVVDLACQLEDICLVPVPTFFSVAQVEHLLHDAGVELLICGPGFMGPIEQEVSTGTVLLSGLPGFTAVRLSPAHAALTPPATSKVTYTSGSTGDPKGVCLSLQQCVNVAKSLSRAIGVKKPRHLCLLPLSTLLENIGGIYMPLLSGGSMIVEPSSALGLTGSSGINRNQLLGALARYQPHTMILVPQLLALLADALEEGWKAPTSLSFVAVGGGRVAPSMLERVRGHGVPVYEGYGLSECASVVSLNTPGHDRAGTSGKVLPHVQVSVVDDELEISGNTFLGYLGEPETWHQRPVQTGDIGHVDDEGYITVQGRRKNVLISSFGRNISPEWVESELLADGMFQQAVVLGDARPWCVALLVPRDQAMPDARLQAQLDAVNSNLPDYAQIREWRRLPEPLTAPNGMLTANGRPRRQTIDQQYAGLIDQMYGEAKELSAL